MLDAESLHRDALDLVTRGDLRDASEKAWGAMIVAAKGVLVAKDRGRPDTTTRCVIALGSYAERDQRALNLWNRLTSAAHFLHGQCFYNGVCEPPSLVERRIRDVEAYIQEARRLAGLQNRP